jgi:LexA DNA binding domain
MLDKDALEELRNLLQVEYGYEHSDEEAREIGTRLLRLLELLVMQEGQDIPRPEPVPTERRALAYLHEQIIHYGHSPSVRELSAAMGYRSSRSGSQLLERLIKIGSVFRGADGKLSLLHR